MQFSFTILKILAENLTWNCLPKKEVRTFLKDISKRMVIMTSWKRIYTCFVNHLHKNQKTTSTLFGLLILSVIYYADHILIPSFLFNYFNFIDCCWIWKKVQYITVKAVDRCAIHQYHYDWSHWLRKIFFFEDLCHRLIK